MKININIVSVERNLNGQKEGTAAADMGFVAVARLGEVEASAVGKTKDEARAAAEKAVMLKVSAPAPAPAKKPAA